MGAPSNSVRWTFYCFHFTGEKTEARRGEWQPIITISRNQGVRLISQDRGKSHLGRIMFLVILLTADSNEILSNLF